MSLTITPINYYQYGKCDALADLEGTWTGNSAGTESDFYKEGTGCLGFTIRAIGQNDILYTKTSGTWDLSGIKHLRLWFLCSTPNAINIDDPTDPANAGIQFFVGDATNTAYYKVSGKTSYPGGWYNLVVDLFRTQDSGTKPTGMLCTKIGLRMNMTVAPKNVDNVWIDNLIICDGLRCESDTQFTLQDIYDKDNTTTGGWGVIRKIGGIYYLTGNLFFGDASGANSCDFKDVSQVMVFEDRKVNTDLYEIKAINNTGVCKVQFGDRSGAAGISGCTLRAVGTAKYKITCVDTDVSDFKLYGSTFYDAGDISLPPVGDNREVLNCNFEACAEVLVDTCKVENCNFVSSDGKALKISSDFHGVKNCNFISCPTAIHHDVGGSEASPLHIDYDNLKFSGNNVDIENSASFPNYYILIDRLNDSNPTKINNPNGGTTTLIPISVVLTLTGLKPGSEVRIYKSGTTNELDGIESSGTYWNYSYYYLEGAQIDIVVHHLEYLYWRLDGYTPGQANASLPVVQQLDRQYYNPPGP